MEVWLWAEAGTVEHLARFARDAEEMGYTGLVLPEHIVVKEGDRTPHPNGYQMAADTPFLDPLCLFSAMAAVTTTLRFMTFVLVVPLRNPFALAKQIATLELISGNRFQLGTGVGWLREEFETVGEGWGNRGKRMDEMLTVMRDFWDDGYAELHGEHYDFPRSGMFPVPTERVPILIGGHSDAAARRAARFDGYIPMDGLHDRTRREFGIIDEYRAEHGLVGRHQRLITGNFDPGLESLRRMRDDDGITGVLVSPWRGWRQESAARTYEERIDLARRYADEVMRPVQADTMTTR